MAGPERVSLEEIIKLIDQLPPEEQSKLRRTLLEDQLNIRVSLKRMADSNRRWSLQELEQELDLVQEE